MNASELLNADMATLGRLLQSGFGWWREQLAALVPASWRARGNRRQPVLALSDDLQLPIDLPGKVATARARTVVLLPARAALTRRALLPALPRAELSAAIIAEAGRLFPLPVETMLIAWREIGRDPVAGSVDAEVAMLPRATGAAIAATLTAHELAPARVGIAGDATGTAPGWDFLPALRSAGLLPPPSRQPAIWWAIVAFLFLLNLAVIVWRDEVRVEQAQALVAAQRPAVAGVQRLQRRIARFDALAAAAADRRGREPLALLGDVARTLPDGAFLLRFTLEAGNLRLSGYKPTGDNVVSRLRGLDRLTEVRALRSEGEAEFPGSQPFDITAKVAP